MPKLFILALAVGLTVSAAVPVLGDHRLRALIVDGENKYHEWQKTTPILKQILEGSGRFVVDVSTAPPPRHDMSEYRPEFKAYDVIVGNYNGSSWPEATRGDFEAYVSSGGGYVSVHAANNAFPEWDAYNQMIALGGWGGRSEASGPYVYYRDDSLVRDTVAGEGGAHGDQHEFVVVARDAEHPIMRGLPAKWMHTKDELYERLRGPAENLHVLASAYADPKYKGSDRHEPMLMTVRYGRGRVFHTTLGHADYSMRCVGFVTTLCRGAEWAATGEVTLGVPEDFPTEDKPRPWSPPQQ